MGDEAAGYARRMGPQQPEIGRSGRTFVNQDHAEDVLDVEQAPEPKGRTGRVPDANTPGHHPGHEQDKPDLDAFAERFGVHGPGEGAGDDGGGDVTPAG